MFAKVLVANRGEIACRVIAALRALGIASVAVYSEADAQAPHRALADEAVPIGPAPVQASYLRADAMIQAALATGAEAIHPGYGLLSENADFAQAVAAAGLTFIGPTPEAIRVMGDKARARELARAAGLPVVPGSEGLVSDEAAPALASAIGYPVLVKAAAGGGGIGMAVVAKPEKLARALTTCRDRGQVSFGSPAVYLEKYIEGPRHIEVQLLFDHHGHGVHLFERDCTVQRRHQKVIEEAPSAFVARFPGLRERLCAHALAVGHAIGYRGVGTVEFIVSPEGEPYFIEMNTRLQVEHPVTEAITGVDLVAWQLKVAAGEPLTLRQETLKVNGAAVECRLYAESPERGFIPRPGHLTRFEPAQSVRVDTGVQSGQDITPYYDPLLAKLIAHAPTRAEALARAREALDATVIEGLDTNRALLSEVLGGDDFRAGQVDTSWLERYVKARTA